MIAGLSESGVAVVEHGGYGIPQGLTELGDYRGLGLDAEAHAGEECHVAVVNGDADTRPACADPGRHAKKGASELKAAKPAHVVPSAKPAGATSRRPCASRPGARGSSPRAARPPSTQGERRQPRTPGLHPFGQQFPAKAACDLLGLEAPPASEEYRHLGGARAHAYADGGDPTCSGPPWPSPPPSPRSTWARRGLDPFAAAAPPR